MNVPRRQIQACEWGNTAMYSHFSIKPILPFCVKVVDNYNLEKSQFRQEINMHFCKREVLGRGTIISLFLASLLALEQHSKKTAWENCVWHSFLHSVFSFATMFSKLLFIKFVSWWSVGSNFHKKYFQVNYQSLTYFTLCYAGLSLRWRLSFVEVFQ